MVRIALTFPDQLHGLSEVTPGNFVLGSSLVLELAD
jgi:hypothetical protein